MKKSDIGYYLSIPVLYLVSVLPFPLLYMLSDVFRFIVFDVVKYRKRVIERNLRNSFPEKSEEERLKIVKDFQRNFSDMIFECIKMLTISNKTLKRHYRVNNYDEIINLQHQGRGIIGTVGHMFNWEWGGFYNSNKKNNRYPNIIVYKTLQDKKFDEFLYSLRSRWGSILTSMEQAARTMIAYRNQPFTVFLAADQHTNSSAAYSSVFLNQKTKFNVGLERIAKLTNGVVAFYDIIKIKRGYYEVNIDVLCDTPKETADGELTELYIRRLEKTIKEHPAQWLWTHKRWK